MKGNICPLCGEENGCHMALELDPHSCWCMSKKIPQKLLLLGEEKGDACICRACIERAMDSEKISIPAT